ncbi:MAG: hypothetical protein JSS27_20260 [Planctomycetes bacterium]|nr:hypothetical protein [Planctomycetota bacterium]
MSRRRIYVAGDTETPTATKAMHTFWSLDLDNLDPGWRAWQPWPGPKRMLAVAGSHDGKFYLFGGAALDAGPDGKPVRRWLTDAYCYSPTDGWRRLADLPRPCVAAPSPAVTTGDGKLLILGGDDGRQLTVPHDQHQGFPRDVLVYDVKTDRWSRGDEVPFSLVTTPAVIDGDTIIVPGGESQPGVRSTEVWQGRFVTDDK